MKIEKAIEILDLNVKEAGKKMPPDTLDALKLGVEALRKIEYDRLPGIHPLYPNLPGETKEN